MFGEEFLHYLWKFRLLNLELKSVSGEEVVVLHPGEHNTNGGPDFLNARVRIGGTVWAGNVEIHHLSSDWFRHKHHQDKAYENVILHVVYRFEPEMDPLNIPTLVLEGQFPSGIRLRYEGLMQNQQWIPCSNSLDGSLQPDLALWYPSLVIERLARKCSEIKVLWESCRCDWEETLYCFLALNFGFRLNSVPFELMARSLPLKLLQRHATNITTLESLFFGQAGMLSETYSDTYPVMLREEYGYLKLKFRLTPALQTSWRFLRLRPSNFPTIRISQFASFFYSTEGRFFQLLYSCGKEEIQKQFELTASGYWDDHFMFDRSSPKRKKILGEDSRLLLMINGIVPFLFFIGLEKQMISYRDKAIEILESLPGEQNFEITRWREAGFDAGDALKTQALIQLKRVYCDRKRCLECRLGIRILSR